MLATAGRGLARMLADFVVPPACAACATPLERGQALCGPCWRTVRFIRHPLCDRTGMPMPYDPGGIIVSAKAIADPPDYDRARVVAEHAGAIRRLVLGLKYHDRLEPRRLLGRWLADAGRELLSDADALVPVPLHRLRLLTRRFNQSALLAGEVGRIAHVPVLTHVLTRPKRTPHQVALTGAQRLDNPRGAFRVPRSAKRRLSGARIVLVDDVITTGATVNACARALKAAGAARVDVLALTLAINPAAELGDDSRLR